MYNQCDDIVYEERRYASLPYTETGENHQKFSDIVNSYGLPGCQNEPWCATYQFAIELETVGKDQALKNWNMTESTYCGYSCKSTRNKFREAGKTGMTPKVGALVIFTRSHMGRVLSVNTQDKTFECGEGNTSNRQYDRNGDSCAVKTYSWTDPGIDCFCYIDYGDNIMKPQKLISSAAAVCERARREHWVYGDSHSLPPCEDHVISCDRMIARALWNLSYTKQPVGGITVLNMEKYLLSWGFSKITDPNRLRAGDIVLMSQNGTSSPTANWHTFLISRFGSVNDIDKYDCGSQQRVNSVQPFKVVPLNQWPGIKSFYCGFRCPSDEPKKKTHVTLEPVDLKRNTNSIYSYLGTEILKSRNYKGRIVNGKHKELALDFRWSTSDMSALAHYRADRIDQDVWQLGQGEGAGEMDKTAWVDLLGHSLPYKLPLIPKEETEGTGVLLVQEILRSRDIKGKDGQTVGLDRKYNENTRAAIMKYQKARGLKQTGEVDYQTWKDMTGVET